MSINNLPLPVVFSLKHSIDIVNKQAIDPDRFLQEIKKTGLAVIIISLILKK